MKNINLITLIVPTEKTVTDHDSDVAKWHVLSQKHETVVPIFENHDEFAEIVSCLDNDEPYIYNDGVNPETKCVVSYDCGVMDYEDLMVAESVVDGYTDCVNEDTIHVVPAMRALLQAQAPSLLPIFDANLAKDERVQALMEHARNGRG